MMREDHGCFPALIAATDDAADATSDAYEFGLQRILGSTQLLIAERAGPGQPNATRRRAVRQ